MTIVADITNQELFAAKVDNILTDQLKGSGPFYGNLIIIEKLPDGGFFDKAVTGEIGSRDFQEEYGFALRRGE